MKLVRASIRMRMAKTRVMCRLGDSLQHWYYSIEVWYMSDYELGANGGCIRRQECTGLLLGTICNIHTHCEKSLLLLKIHRRFHNIKICRSWIVL